MRNRGTLQVSRWTFQNAPNFKRLFVVVTRQDTTWYRHSEKAEPYALCAVLDDRENVNLFSSLYAQIKAQLQAKIQIRQKAKL